MNKTVVFMIVGAMGITGQLLSGAQPQHLTQKQTQVQDKNQHYVRLDDIETLSALLDFDMNSFQGKPGSEADVRLEKTWNFAMDRVHKYIFTAFRSSDLPALAKRVDELGKDIFAFQIYKSKNKSYNQKYTEYTDKIYDSRELLHTLAQIEQKKDSLKKDVDKKLGFKDKAKLFFASKTTKAIKNDEQEVRAFLSTIIDKLSNVITQIKKIIQDPRADQETLRRLGY